MKKITFLVMAVAGCSLLNSCSKKEITASADETTQQLTIQVASSGDGLQTRAGRPLYASNADQDIANVKVIVKDGSDNIQYATVIDNWNTISSEYSTGGHGRQYTLTLKGEDKLEPGTYTILAVGYSNPTDYVFSPAMDVSVKEYTLSTDITATAASNAEEVFAGAAEVTVGTDKSFAPVPVVLHRQVAGALGYFTNIPAGVDGKAAATLRLVTRSKNTVLTFNNFNSTFTESDASVKHIVNGSTPAGKDAKFFGSDTDDANVLYSVDLSDWFTAGDSNSDGFLNEDDTWVHPTSVQTVLTEGTVLAGKFIIPFALTEDQRTMELQLLAADNTILRSWGVNIPTAHLATGKSDPEVNDESESTFNVVRNHMYNLGVKTTHEEPTDPSNPGGDDKDPDDPDNDDEPTDLSKNQDLVLKVNDNWEMIHQMELN